MSPAEEYEATLRLLRGDLRNSEGVSYKAFKAGLKPDFGRVWRDLLPGHLAIAGALAALAAARGLPLPVQAALALPGAAVLGAAINYIYLFTHEANHHGLHPDRKANDRLVYALIGIVIGMDIDKYRHGHFEHHRRLGETDDAEHSYFEALDWRFVLGSLTGVRTIRLALTRGFLLGAGKARPAAAPAAGPARRVPWPLLGGLAFNGALVAGLALLGAWAAALAWVLAVGIVFPFLGSVRQILEHRGEAARADVDYAQVPHGAQSRLFGDGAFARFFGGAGFNRHLLHHFEPAVHYTRLPELEAFLRDTPVAPYLARRTTTYGATFRALFGRR